MTGIGDWLKVLIVVVLLGNLVDFVLPKGDLKRYGGLVVGLVILATIITPLWGWMHQLHRAGTNLGTQDGWTNSPTGYTAVVSQEELHQAEAIVLSMPHVIGCQLTMGSNETVEAAVQTDGTPVTRTQLRHYVRAALDVTMGHAPSMTLTVSSSADPHGAGTARQN